MKTEAKKTSGEPHGGNVHKLAGELAITAAEVLDFSASLNPLGIPASVLETLRENIGLACHYPEPDAESLTAEIARNLGIERELLICGNGSTELIYLTVRAIKPRRVLIPAPTFSEYQRACQVYQQTVATEDNPDFIRYLALDSSRGFEISAPAFAAAAQGCDLAFLCNPNNPTGTLMQRDDLLALAQSARDMGFYLLVDEAFTDFVPEVSVVDKVAENPYLIVLRSLTKFYALAGLRLGYGMFPRELVARIKQAKEPWSVNTLAIKAGSAALQDRGFQQETLRLLAREKVFLEDSLAALRIPFLASAVNYYLLRLNNAGKITAALRKKGILVRDCSNFLGLEAGYIRIAVRSRQENSRLLAELEVLCGE